MESAPRSRNRVREGLWDAPWVVLLVMLLVDPLLCSVKLHRRGAKLVFDSPHVQSGDEPHYLVMLNSLIEDGDLDLANNYGSVHQGSSDAGASFARSALDHHVRWYEGTRLRSWWQIFETDAARWRRDARGAPMPTLRKGVPSDAPPKHEYSWHAPGLPLLLSPLVWPFRGSRWIEPAAICWSTMAVAAAMFLLRMLITPYSDDSNVLWMTTAVAMFGTPAWHYGRTLFCEPYLLAFAVGAYTLALRRSSYRGAGILIALGVLMKPPFAVLAIPLAMDLVRARAAEKIVLLAVPVLFSVAAILAFNYGMHGSCFRSPVKWQSGNFFEGGAGLLFSRKHGLLPFAPAAIVALAAWPCFLRSHRRDAIVLLSGFCLYFGLMAAWKSWHGSTCYGPRMIVPVIPFLFAALPMVPQCQWWRSAAAKVSAITVCSVSVVINAFSAFCHGQVWDTHPFAVLFAWCFG